MSDLAFVASSYAIVLGGLAAYAASIGRRTRAARRTAQLLEREHGRVLPEETSEPRAAVTGEVSEVL